MSKLPVLIAGGSGLIGFRLAKSLLDDGHEPIILSRHADEVRRRSEMWAFKVRARRSGRAGPLARRNRRL